MSATYSVCGCKLRLAITPLGALYVSQSENSTMRCQVSNATCYQPGRRLGEEMEEISAGQLPHSDQRKSTHDSGGGAG